MADEVEKFRSMPVFWTSDDEKSGNLAVVPGVTRLTATGVGNIRPKVRGHRTKEVKAGVPRHQPLVDELTPKTYENVEEEFESSSDKENSTSNQRTFTKETCQPRPKSRLMQDMRNKPRPRNHSRKASLSDLCIEDKKRVANLITELAKLGEEKESAVETLRGERNRFEQKIASVLEQKDSILREREDIEKQLEECQELLMKYQDQIQQHQEQLKVAEEVLPPNRASTPVKTPPQPRQAPDDTATSPRRGANLYTPKQMNAPQIPVTDPSLPVAPPLAHYMLYPPYLPLPHSYPYPYPVQPDLHHPKLAPGHGAYTNKIDAEIANERKQIPLGHRPDRNGYRTDEYQLGHLPDRNGYRTDEYQLGHLPDRNGYRTDEYQLGDNWVKPDLYYEATGVEAPDYHSDDWDLETHRHRGLLQNPLLSSTQRSGGDMSQAKNGGQFEPLVPDFSDSYRSISPSRRAGYRRDNAGWNGRRGNGGGNGKQGDVNGGGENEEFDTEVNYHRDYRGFNQDQNHRRAHHSPDVNNRHGLETSPISTNFHDHVNGDSFGTYYKKLTPEQRRKQLVSQKEALIREQHRLRKILEEQEGLLREKQLQLRHQQEKQRRRLKTFERTGEFPLPTDTEESGVDAVEEKQRNKTNPSRGQIRDDPSRGQIRDDPSRGQIRDDPSWGQIRDDPSRVLTMDMATSPVKFSDEVHVPETPRFIDVATEMTQRDRVTPTLMRLSPRDCGKSGSRMLTSPGFDLDASRQCNLPVTYDQPHLTPRSGSLETPPSSERALSVVDIVDSMERSKSVDYLPSSVHRGSHQSDTEEEEAEESHLLEDVFFLH